MFFHSVTLDVTWQQNPVRQVVIGSSVPSVPSATQFGFQAPHAASTSGLTHQAVYTEGGGDGGGGLTEFR